MRRYVSTYVDEILVVADEQVAQDTGLVQVSEGDHVLYTLHRGGVHRLDAALRCQPYFLQQIFKNKTRVVIIVFFKTGHY